MNTINSGPPYFCYCHNKPDWLLDPCFTNCFVCGKPFDSPPLLDKYGKLKGRALVLDVIVDEDNITKEETEERICNKCWVSDLSL